MNAKQRWYQNNKELTIKRAAESKARKYEWYREYMSDKSCSMCGVTEDLQWHHTHDNKLDNVGDLLYKKGKDIILQEIAKCICVCKECHQKLHSSNHEDTQ